MTEVHGDAVYNPAVELGLTVSIRGYSLGTASSSGNLQ
jgi:hypothetical protein